MHVYTPNVSKAQHTQWLSGNAIVKQIPFYAFSLRNNIGRTATGYRVCQHQQLALQTFCRGEHKSCKCMYSYWHMRQPCCDHTKQASLRRHGMNHPWPFPSEYAYQATQCDKILPWRNMPFHGNCYCAYPFPFGDGLHLLAWGRKSHNLILLAQFLQQTTTKYIETHWNRCRTDNLHNLIKRLRIALGCILNFKLLPKRRYPSCMR